MIKMCDPRYESGPASTVAPAGAAAGVAAALLRAGIAHPGAAGNGHVEQREVVHALLEFARELVEPTARADRVLHQLGAVGQRELGPLLKEDGLPLG